MATRGGPNAPAAVAADRNVRSSSVLLLDWTRNDSHPVFYLLPREDSAPGLASTNSYVPYRCNSIFTYFCLLSLRLCVMVLIHMYSSNEIDCYRVYYTK